MLVDYNSDYEYLDKFIYPYSVKSFRKAYELEPNNPEYRKKIESVKATVFKNYTGIDIQNAKIQREEFKGKIGDPLLIKEKIDLIKFSCQISSDGDKNPTFNVKIAPNFSVKVDLTNFPMRPILEIPNSVKEKIGDLNVILGSLRNWNEFHDTDVVVVLNELKACLGYYGYGKILISRSFVDLVYEEAIAQSTEIIGFLKMNRWIISELQMASGYYSAPKHAHFSSDVILRDDALIGMVHSHPNGIAYPSHADMNTFRSFKINMIIAFPRRELKLFNDLGSGVSYEIVDTFKLDHGRKLGKKPSTGSGRISNESKKDNDKMMYS